MAQNSPGINPTTADRVLAEIDEHEVVEFLRGLVQIPTINPPGDVRQAIQYCTDKLAAEGFEIDYISAEEAKPNLLATITGAPGPTLLLNAHVDVVPTGDENNWTHPPFGAELVYGRVYGRGAGDDKASVTAQVMSAIALARSGLTLNGTLIVNEVADEEIGGALGAQLVAEDDRVKPDLVIVGEQTLNRVCLGEKGSAGTTVTVFGRAAHGALPWEGVNAIEGMTSVISALQQELWPQLAERTHPLFKPSSATIAIIEGGVKSNVVPDQCTIRIDRRLVPGETPDQALNEIREIAEKAVAGISGMSVKVEASGWSGREARFLEPEAPLARTMLQTNEHFGLSTEPTGFSMATDGRHFAAQNIPTIIYGPGDPALAHQPDEWVGVDEVLEATRVYAVTAATILNAK